MPELHDCLGILWNAGFAQSPSTDPADRELLADLFAVTLGGDASLHRCSGILASLLVLHLSCMQGARLEMPVARCAALWCSFRYGVSACSMQCSRGRASIGTIVHCDAPWSLSVP